MESARDVVIVISGTAFTVVVLLIGVISYRIYRRTDRILKTAEKTTTKIEALATLLTDEIGSPLVRLASIIQVISYEVKAVTSIFKREEKTK